MSFVSVLHRLLRPSVSTGRPRRSQPRKAAPRSSIRPGLEALEARLVPSTVPIVVTSLADNGPGTLRAAIAAAHSGDAIVFAPSVHDITLTSGQLAVTQSLTIDG